MILIYGLLSSLSSLSRTETWTMLRFFPSASFNHPDVFTRLIPIVSNWPEYLGCLSNAVLGKYLYLKCCSPWPVRAMEIITCYLPSIIRSKMWEQIKDRYKWINNKESSHIWEGFVLLYGEFRDIDILAWFFDLFEWNQSWSSISWSMTSRV